MTDDSAETSLPVFSTGGRCEQFWHSQECTLFDVGHSALPLPTTAPPTLEDVWEKPSWRVTCPKIICTTFRITTRTKSPEVLRSSLRFNPFPAFRTLYEVCGKVHSVQFVCCYRMLNANFLRKFQLSVHSEAKLNSKDEYFWSL